MRVYLARQRQLARLFASIFVVGTIFISLAWLDTYRKCTLSDFDEIHPDVLQPITSENIDRLQKVRLFEDDWAERAFFDPTGDFLIIDSGLDYGFHTSTVKAFKLNFSCLDHRYMVMRKNRNFDWQIGLWQRGGCFSHNWNGVSSDGRWLVVSECGSWHRYRTHLIDLQTGRNIIVSSEEFRQWLESANIELLRDNANQSVFSRDSSLELREVEDQYEWIAVFDTDSGEVVKELRVSRDPCNTCGSENCGVWVGEYFFSPDGKYIVATMASYCDVGFRKLHMWVVPDTTAEE